MHLLCLISLSRDKGGTECVWFDPESNGDKLVLGILVFLVY